MDRYFHPESNMHLLPGQHFIIDDVQYPPNWLECATAEQIGELGLVPVVTVGARGDDRYFDNSEMLDGPTLTITAAQKPIEQLKAIKSQEIAAARFALEVSGITLPSGTRVATDRDSQAMISGALLTAQRRPDTMIDWKGREGWSQINKAAIEAIADAVSAHVQACFSAERARCAALEALTEFDDVVAFDPSIII